jgi:hypothetical protein
MRKSTLVLSVTLAAAAASSSWLWQQWHEERAVNIALRAHLNALEQHPESNPPVPTPAFASAAVSTGLAPANSKELRSYAADKAAAVNYSGKVQQRLLKNPQFREALRNQQRRVIETEYRDLPKFLNLSPEEGARLFDLLAEQGEKTLELQWRGPIRQEGGSPTPPNYQELRAKVEAENAAGLARLLGAQNMNRLQEFRSTLQSRIEVDAVRGELARGPDPLREDQVEPMIGVVNAELQRMNQELRDASMMLFANGYADPAAEGKRSELAIAANQRIVDAAGSILTNTQLAALKELYRRQRLQMETSGEVNRLRAEAMTEVSGQQ